MENIDASEQQQDERRPSTETEEYWLYIYHPHARPEGAGQSGGKWLVFVPIIEVDVAWTRIRQAVIDGLLARLCTKFSLANEWP